MKNKQVHKPVTPYKPLNTHLEAEPVITNVEKELRYNSDKKYNVRFLKDLLDTKLSEFVQSIQMLQNHNFNLEDDILERLNSLKTQNATIEQLYQTQMLQAKAAQDNVKLAKEQHQKKKNVLNQK